jgi:hypothetical protein
LEAFARGGSKKKKKRNTSGEVKKRSLLPYLVKSKRIISQSLFFIFGFLEDVKLIAGNWLPERNPDLF